MAVRPNAKSLSVSQGKGTSLLAAKVSASMEAIELYHAENIEKPLIFTSHSALINSDLDVVSIRHLARSREHTFNPHIRRPWIEAHCVHKNSSVYVPFEILDLNTTGDTLGNYGAFIVDSNGLAAGNSCDEAVLHGLYECIERDAIALWSCAPASHKIESFVDIETLDDPICGVYIDKIRNAGLQTYIWNAVSDIGIPTFVCLICCPHNQVRPGFGSGTHLNKGVALLKAVTEAAQSRLTFISGARDDQTKALYHKQMQKSEANSYALMRPNNQAGLNYQHITSPQISAPSDQDINIICKSLSLCGVNTILTVDLTKPEINIPVVRVLVPGLENLSKAHVRIPGERLMSHMKAYAHATH